MITVTKEVSKVETLKDGQIGFKIQILVMDGETLVTRSNHRGTLAPGEDIASYTGAGQSLEGVDISLLETEKTAHHTPEKVAAFKAKREKKQK